jgi:hypothetical protein
MKKQRTGIMIALALLLFSNCGDKEDKTSAFLPVDSIIKGEIKDIDTSLYSIIKVTYVDTIRSDTDYIKREEVRGLAGDFLSLPELSKKRYTEENVPGPMEGESTLTYKAIHPEQEELKQVDVIINPALQADGKNVVTTIIIERMLSSKDSLVEKKLLWQTGKSFQVTTIKQLPGATGGLFFLQSNMERRNS